METQDITFYKLERMRFDALLRFGSNVSWTMPPEVFNKIRRLKDDAQNYVYSPFVDDGGATCSVPPLLGLPVRVSSAYVGIDIVPVSVEEVPAPADDPVAHPKHYTSHPSGIERIQITEHMGFNLGNAVKYIWRADLKHDDATEDLKKAKWYIERELQKRGAPCL